MTALKKTAIRLAVLPACLALWLAPAHSQVAASPKLDEQVSKQEGIYRSQGTQLRGVYVVNRTLSAYAELLSSGFDRSLAELGPGDRWLDIGAGEGQAILDYYAPEYGLAHEDDREWRDRKARTVAISIEDRRTPRWHKTAASLGSDKIQYLYNKSLREYSLEELGRFQIITDVVGGFSYTPDLSRFAEKVLGFLELNGTFYTLLQDVHAEDGRNKPHYAGARFLTEIVNGDGSEVGICTWLKSISCVEVTCQFGANWVPPVEVYRIRKVCNDVAVPALVPVHYEPGTPPERRFQLRTPPLTDQASQEIDQ